MGDSWHFVHQQQAKGPVGISELEELLQHGVVTPDTLVWRPGVDQWKQLKEYPQLLDLAHKPPSKRRKVVEEDHEIIPILADMADDVLRDLFWKAATTYQYDLLDGFEDARDTLLEAFIENCPDMDGDPDSYEFSDDFFCDLLVEVGKDELWKYIKGDMEAVIELLQGAADLDPDFYTTVKAVYTIGRVRESLAAGNVSEALEVAAQEKEPLKQQDLKGNSLLHVAAHYGVAKLLELVESAGTLAARVVNAANLAGDTPLHVAVRESKKEVVQRLLELGARVDRQNKDTSKYADGSWVLKGGPGDEFNIPLPHLDCTPLHMAAAAGDTEMLELMLNHATAETLQIRNAEGATVLHCALESQEEGTVAAVLNAGGDPTSVAALAGEGQTPLHQACSQGAIGIAALLLGTGKVDVSKADQQGWTPLHLAARRGSVPCVQLLLLHGADPSVPNKQGKTAAQIAEVNKKQKVLEVLQTGVGAGGSGTAH